MANGEATLEPSIASSSSTGSPRSSSRCEKFPSTVPEEAAYNEGTLVASGHTPAVYSSTVPEADLYEERPRLPRPRRSWFLATQKVLYSDGQAAPLPEVVLMVIDGYAMQIFLACVVTLNFALMCVDIDARAAEKQTPTWTENWFFVCFVVYWMDLILRFYAERLRTFLNPWNWLDLVLVALGTVDEVWSRMSSTDMENMKLLRLLRLLRLCRLVKLFRIVRYFKTLRELKKLAMMFESCIKTLLWALIVCVLIMTIWAAIGVEAIQPVISKLAKTGIWDECDRCEYAFASIMDANLTLFQTIVAGDSWGQLAIPVIEESPVTSIIFLLALFTMVYGLLQLIVCVIVDSFAEIREKDLATRVRDIEQTELEEKRALKRIFKRIDTDRDGTVSFQELLEGAKNVPEFGQRLRVMDINMSDLGQLFAMLDEDRSGEVDALEFIEVIYRMMTTDARSATVFVKEYTKDIQKRQEVCEKSLESIVTAHTCVAESLRKAGDQIQDVLRCVSDVQINGESPGREPPRSEVMVECAPCGANSDQGAPVGSGDGSTEDEQLMARLSESKLFCDIAALVKSAVAAGLRESMVLKGVGDAEEPRAAEVTSLQAAERALSRQFRLPSSHSWKLTPRGVAATAAASAISLAQDLANEISLLEQQEEPPRSLHPKLLAQSWPHRNGGLLGRRFPPQLPAGPLAHGDTPWAESPVERPISLFSEDRWRRRIHQMRILNSRPINMLLESSPPPTPRDSMDSMPPKAASLDAAGGFMRRLRVASPVSGKSSAPRDVADAATTSPASSSIEEEDQATSLQKEKVTHSF